MPNLESLFQLAYDMFAIFSLETWWKICAVVNNFEKLKKDSNGFIGISDIFAHGEGREAQ